MKKFSQINESLKDPIDVESDIIEFKEKMGKAYHDRFLKMYTTEEKRGPSICKRRVPVNLPSSNESYECLEINMSYYGFI